MTEEQIEEIRQIARTYRNFQCLECSQYIQRYLQREGIQGKLIKISTNTDRLPFAIITNPIGSDRQIALNGFHQGIVIQIENELGRVETVFDNLYPDGIPKQEWLNSFGGPLVEDFNGKFTVIETEF
ncbi:papain fold toxin domain-containing protein [Aerosakkonemataceae cyanobacterium BLCC-F50]|uniref:Papain fold toxin domain-containing protein n=1 Tax=Floridaenema flaviceps BLCC-F50 TaxID=3153642 RepID=A0ABV4XKK5_9CYAN